MVKPKLPIRADSKYALRIFAERILRELPNRHDRNIFLGYLVHAGFLRLNWREEWQAFRAYDRMRRTGGEQGKKLSKNRLAVISIMLINDPARSEILFARFIKRLVEGMSLSPVSAGGYTQQELDGIAASFEDMVDIARNKPMPMPQGAV